MFKLNQLLARKQAGNQIEFRILTALEDVEAGEEETEMTLDADV